MTWSARFAVTDVSVGPAPIEVVAVARTEDGTLVQNTEHASLMQLRIQLDADETAIQVGDEITGSGHFIS